MQLMTFNSLLMFDIVFVFFLFLVGVTCLVYYLPPARHTSAKSCRHHSHYHHHHHHPHSHHLTHRLHRECGGGVASGVTSSSTLVSPSGCGGGGGGKSSCPISDGGGGGGHAAQVNILDNCSATLEFFTEASSSCGQPKMVNVVEKVIATSASPQCCYVKAKHNDVKQCTGPVQDV